MTRRMMMMHPLELPSAPETLGPGVLAAPVLPWSTAEHGRER